MSHTVKRRHFYAIRRYPPVHIKTKELPDDFAGIVPVETIPLNNLSSFSFVTNCLFSTKPSDWLAPVITATDEKAIPLSRYCTLKNRTDKTAAYLQDGKNMMP
jgi:hypothetical protein